MSDQASLDLKAWRNWNGPECGFFLAYYLQMPTYRTTAERNLTGKKLEQLHELDYLSSGLLRMGITSHADQRDISQAVHLLVKGAYCEPCRLDYQYRKRKTLPVRLPTLAKACHVPGLEKAKIKKSLSQLELKLQQSMSDTLNRNPSLQIFPPFGCGDDLISNEDAQKMVKSTSNKALATSEEEYKNLKEAVERDHQSTEERLRVDQLIDTMIATKDVLDNLPTALLDAFTEVEFAKLAATKFAQLDVDASGELEALELAPVVKHLTPGSVLNEISQEQCSRVMAIFDVDKSGAITIDEFSEFLKFILAIHYRACLRISEECALQMVHSALQQGKREYDTMRKTMRQIRSLDQFLQVLLEDGIPSRKEILASSPPEFIEECGAEFEQHCLEMYKDMGLHLLTNRGLKLPNKDKLRWLLGNLSNISPAFIKTQVVDRFHDCIEQIREGDLSGGISEETFVSVCIIFKSVYNVGLKETRDAMETGTLRAGDVLDDLKENLDTIFGLIPTLPTSIQSFLNDSDFTRNAKIKFDQLDIDHDGNLSAEELHPVLVELLSAHSKENTVNSSHCARFVELIDTDKTGKVSLDNFIDFCRFTCVVSYLETQDNEEAKKAQRHRRDSGYRGELPHVEQERERQARVKRIDRMILRIKASYGFIEQMTLWKKLPKSFRDLAENKELFQLKCDATFDQVAVKEGELNLEQLGGVLEQVIEVQDTVTDEMMENFGDIFDVDGNGVITRDEFPDFVKFCVMVMYIEGEAEKKETAKKEKQMEEFVALVEQDFRLFWESSDGCTDNFIPVNTRLGREWTNYFVSVDFMIALHDAYMFVDVNKTGKIESAEIVTMLTRLANQAKTDNTYPLARRIIALFDGGKGHWLRSDFAAFLKFLFLLLVLECEARGLECISPTDLYGSLFKSLTSFAAQDHRRLYPGNIKRVEVENRRLFDIWTSSLKEIEVVQACIKIQTRQRMRMSRAAVYKLDMKLNKSKHDAATKLQALARFKKAQRIAEARREKLRLEEEKRLEKEEKDAAIAIQQRFRRNQAKKLKQERAPKKATTLEHIQKQKSFEKERDLKLARTLTSGMDVIDTALESEGISLQEGLESEITPKIAGTFADEESQAYTEMIESSLDTQRVFEKRGTEIVVEEEVEEEKEQEEVEKEQEEVEKEKEKEEVEKEKEKEEVEKEKEEEVQEREEEVEGQAKEEVKEEKEEVVQTKEEEVVQEKEEQVLETEIPHEIAPKPEGDTGEVQEEDPQPPPKPDTETEIQAADPQEGEQKPDTEIQAAEPQEGEQKPDTETEETGLQAG